MINLRNQTVGYAILSIMPYFMFTVCIVSFLFSILPESPRWLNQHKKYGKAQEVLRKIAQKNERPVPSIDVLREAARADLQEAKQLKKFTYLDLFRHREYAKRTVILILMW